MPTASTAATARISQTESPSRTAGLAVGATSHPRRRASEAVARATARDAVRPNPLPSRILGAGRGIGPRTVVTADRAWSSAIRRRVRVRREHTVEMTGPVDRCGCRARAGSAAGSAAKASSRSRERGGVAGREQQRPALGRDQLGDPPDRRADDRDAPAAGLVHHDRRRVLPFRRHDEAVERRRAAPPCVAASTHPAATHRRPAAGTSASSGPRPATTRPAPPRLARPANAVEQRARRPCRSRAGRGSRTSAGGPSPRGSVRGAGDDLDRVVERRGVAAAIHAELLVLVARSPATRRARRPGGDRRIGLVADPARSPTHDRHRVSHARPSRCTIELRWHSSQ